MSKSTWSENPQNGEWNSSENWTPETVPTDDAIFSVSNQTSITFDTSDSAEIDTIEFTEDASPFTMTIGNSPNNTVLTINKGVENKSEHQQTIAVASQGAHYQTPQMKFTGKASAGSDNMLYKAGPTSLQGGFGGGIIAFTDESTAGTASFVARTGAVNPPKNVQSTVGAEISFSDKSNAGKGNFKSYGTLQPVDGEKLDADTFANIVFHDETNAAQGTFISAGGTYGDGGNTQFYDSSNAAQGTFINHGGTMDKANGGDTVFDGNSNGGNGRFMNYAASHVGGYGGVVSFNNNPPEVPKGGSSAGYGHYHNYGASYSSDGGGGHIEFSAVHGSPTAANGNFHNYGSILSDGSTAGHTIFSIDLPTKYYPNAGNGIIWNYPAPSDNGSPGYTEFAVYKSKYYNEAKDGLPSNYPTAANATIHNLGGSQSNAAGGYVKFSGACQAANAKLIAYGGTNGGNGGQIIFEDQAKGDSGSILLSGNGTLDIGGINGNLSAGSLTTNDGIVVVQVGEKISTLALTGNLAINSGSLTFQLSEYSGEFEYGNQYAIMTAQNLGDFATTDFQWSASDDFYANFEISNDTLYVAFERK